MGNWVFIQFSSGMAFKAIGWDDCLVFGREDFILIS